jgi:Sec-independent protein translocase protein TatA
MDNLITLIFIIIAVLSIFGKIQPKKKADTASSNAGGWMAKVNAYLTDLQNKMEQQAKANTSDSSGWDELVEDVEEDDSVYDSDEYSLEDLVLDEDEPYPAVKKKPPAPPLVKASVRPLDRAEAIVEAQQQPAMRAGKTVSLTAGTKRQDLRKAIILSEILGPPVALRDQSGHQR